MTILCIESSTQVCSAAVTIGGMPIAERISMEGGNHAKLLPLFVDSLLEELREKGLQVEAVSLSAGPGSYTGLRIGTSTAKGLCYGLGVPLLPIPTLQVLSASAASRLSKCGEIVLCPMVDARRMEVYTSLYDKDLREIGTTEARVVENSDWLQKIGKEVYYFGDGSEKCEGILADAHIHHIAGVVPEAKYMGLLAERIYSEGYRGADVAYYEPYYLKEFVAAVSHVKGLV